MNGRVVYHRRRVRESVEHRGLGKGAGDGPRVSSV